VETLEELPTHSLSFPLFVKPVAEGTSKGISSASLVHHQEQLRGLCQKLLLDFAQPVLVEAHLPGREFTVGILGTGTRARVVGVLEVLFRTPDQQIYSFDTKEHYETLVEYALLKEPALREQLDAVALAAWRGLGCRDAGRVDIRLNGEGRPQFMEINPLAGLNPIHSDLPILSRLTGLPYLQLIEAILESARSRIKNVHRSAA
jgi:D-alanine-D-alanine ligase